MRDFLFNACIVLEFFGTIVAAIFCGVEGAKYRSNDVRNYISN